MRFYECTFIIRQDLPAQDVHKLADKYKDLVEKMNGKVVKKEYWGYKSKSLNDWRKLSHKKLESL